MPTRARITGIGSYVPERVVTNDELSQWMDTSDEWIIQRTGISERHWVAPDQAPSDLGLAAATVALEDAGVAAEDLDMVLFATIASDHFFPGAACYLQAKMEIPGIPAIDVRQQCSGFVYALSMADQFIRSGFAKRLLVVGAEIHSKGLDISTEGRDLAVLFGDGAGAAVLGEVSDGGILGVALGADGSKGDLLQLPAGGSRMPASIKTVENRLHTIKMEGNILFRHAVKIMADAALAVTEPLGLKGDDIDIIIPHQANIRILNALAKRMGVDPEKKVYLNIEKYGNMSAASSAVALTEAVEEGRIKKGDTILMDAFGGGLTWGALVIKW